MIDVVDCIPKYWPFVRQLRTHPQCVQGFIQQGPISEEQHQAFMEKHAQDYVGQITLTSSSAGGNVSGAVDFSEFSSNQGVFLDVVVSGGLGIGGDGSTSSGTRNLLSLRLAANPPSTLNSVPYIVDSQHMFVAGTDNNRVISGVITLQNP